MSIADFPQFAAACAILFSVVIRWLRAGASWDAVEEGRATAQTLRDLTGVTFFKQYSAAMDSPSRAAEDGEALIVDLEGYEGPLHALLALARSQKVDLMKLSISKLADQYLAFVKQARKLRFSLAADYLVMAAWLAYLKSRLLLPKADRPATEELPPEQVAQAVETYRRVPVAQAVTVAAAPAPVAAAAAPVASALIGETAPPPPAPVVMIPAAPVVAALPRISMTLSSVAPVRVISSPRASACFSVRGKPSSRISSAPRAAPGAASGAAARPLCSGCANAEA